MQAFLQYKGMFKFFFFNCKIIKYWKECLLAEDVCSQDSKLDQLLNCKLNLGIKLEVKGDCFLCFP